MKEEDFRAVLSEWREFRIPQLIQRDLKVPTDSSLIITIIGVRRAGKTYYLYQLIENLFERVGKENILYVNFEHEKLRFLDVEAMSELLKVFYELFSPSERKPIYLFLDEVHLVKDWERWVRRIHDMKKYRIFITGSSSKLLAKEIATALRGRTLSFGIFPFCFREFLKAKGAKVWKELKILPYLERRGEILRYLKEYLEWGGFPEVTLTKDKTIKLRLLKSYYDAIFYKDLIERYSIRNAQMLDAFLKYLLSNFSNYISISKCHAHLRSMGIKVSKKTLLNILKFVEDVSLAFTVEILSFKIKERQRYPRKIYCIDTGLLNSTVVSFSENVGKLAENLVAIELKRRQLENPMLEIYYWKDKYGREIDFVLKEGIKIRELIQVCWDVSKREAKEREVNALIRGMDEFNIKRGTIITEDYKGSATKDGKKIVFVPLWEWLLSTS